MDMPKNMSKPIFHIPPLSHLQMLSESVTKDPGSEEGFDCLVVFKVHAC